MKRARSALLTVGLAVALTLMACGGDSEADKVAEIQQTVQKAAQAYSSGDAAALAEFFTDRGLAEEYGTDRSEFILMPAEELAFPVEIARFGEIKVTDDTALGEVLFELNHTWLDGSTLHLAEVDGQWKIDRGFETQGYAVDLPGVTPIGLEMADFAYLYEPEDLTGANVQAFEITNTGAQEHEAVLIRVNLSDDTEALMDLLLAAGDEAPEGIEFIAATSMEPGQSDTLALSNPLSPGRYMFVCFFEDVNDPDHTHLEKGMFVDFQIGDATPENGAAG